jgi:hypothetical protein
MTDSYAKAREKLKSAEDTSDVCSEIENKKPRKRKLVSIQDFHYCLALNFLFDRLLTTTAGVYNCLW